MRALRILTIGFLITAPAVVRAENRPKVAVMTLVDGTRSLSRSVVDSLTDALRTQLARSGRYIVIDKSRQAAALKRLVVEQKKESYRECYDSSCQIPLGQALAADSILRTKLTRVGSTYLLIAELVDLAKEAVTGAAQTRVRARPASGRDDRLLGAVNTLVHQLTGRRARGFVGLGILGRRGRVGTRMRGGGGTGFIHGIRPPTDEELERRKEQRAKRHAEYVRRREERQAEAKRLREEREREHRIREARADLVASRRTRLIYGWMGIVSGGIVVASGAYLATGKVASYEEAAENAESPKALEKAADEASKARTTGYVLAGIGAAAVGVGLYLVLSAPSLRPVRVSSGSLELDRVPLGGPTDDGGFAVSWGGRF
jgi:hypothetical protein